MRLDRWFQRHFPELRPWRAAEAVAHRPGPDRRQAGRGQGPGRTRPVDPPAARRDQLAAAQARAVEASTVSDRDAAEIQRMVIHRDEHVIVLNKPPGLAVQGGSGTEKHIDGMLDALRFGFEQRRVSCTGSTRIRAGCC